MITKVSWLCLKFGRKTNNKKEFDTWKLHNFIFPKRKLPFLDISPFWDHNHPGCSLMTPCSTCASSMSFLMSKWMVVSWVKGYPQLSSIFVRFSRTQKPSSYWATTMASWKPPKRQSLQRPWGDRRPLGIPIARPWCHGLWIIGTLDVKESGNFRNLDIQWFTAQVFA